MGRGFKKSQGSKIRTKRKQRSQGIKPKQASRKKIKHASKR